MTGVIKTYPFTMFSCVQYKNLPAHAYFFMQVDTGNTSLLFYLAVFHTSVLPTMTINTSETTHSGDNALQGIVYK